MGTKGTIRINSVPRKNYVSSFTQRGYLEECQESFLSRWGDAFYNEITDFVNRVQIARKPEATAHVGTMSLAFCLRLHEAYRKNKQKEAEE